MAEPPNLSRLVLSFPSLLHATPATDSKSTPRSWIQVARTGSFVSSRYGQFSITKTDLAQMLRNFNEVTPKAPTELPVDFDHLSMSPRKPGDGIAAGWFKGLELREDGDELWGHIEWTPRAADAIRSKEYRFVSPSFVKDHTHKDGTKIGTTLLAAAITNHPFLENMKALTLYNFDAMGDVALLTIADKPSASDVRNLAEIGQRVSLSPDPERTPEVDDQERDQTFIVSSTIGEGDDQFVRLKTPEGTQFGWFRAIQLVPARAPQQPTDPLADQHHGKTQEEAMSREGIEKQAAKFANRVAALAKDRTMRQAFDLAQAEDEAGAEAYRLSGLGGATLADDSAGVPVVSLSSCSGESFNDLVMRYATEHRISLRQAVHEVGKARPDLADAR